jgi:hypothetical protein
MKQLETHQLSKDPMCASSQVPLRRGTSRGTADRLLENAARKGETKAPLAASPHLHTPQGSAISVSDQHTTCQPRSLLYLAVKLDYCTAGP